MYIPIPTKKQTLISLFIYVLCVTACFGQEEKKKVTYKEVPSKSKLERQRVKNAFADVDGKNKNVYSDLKGLFIVEEIAGKKYKVYFKMNA